MLHRRVRPPRRRILSPSQCYHYVRTYTKAAYLTDNTLFPMRYMLDPKMFLQPQSVPNKEVPFLVELHAQYSNIFLPN